MWIRFGAPIACLLAGIVAGTGRIHTSDSSEVSPIATSQLCESLKSIADSYPGEIGVAVIIDTGDTLAVNNETKYPMMSVFKLHQAIALSDHFERTGESLDSVVSIPRSQLNPNTWSPMLKDYPEQIINIPIRELLTYTLTLSDNNASNWMFENLQAVDDADSFLATLIPRTSFSMRHTEAEMATDHSLAYENCTSPLGAAILINRLYSDSIIKESDADFIRKTLDGCQTGADRIIAPLKGKAEITAGHKTGSGYRNEKGELAAHNDVGFIRLPDGRHYALAVFVKDFNGSEEEASKVISRISETVFKTLCNFASSK